MKKLLRIFGRILSTAATLLLVLILLCNLYILAARELFHVPQPAVFGHSAAVVMSGSMSGAIEVNDMVIVRHGAPCTVGDVIMFQSGNSLVTHRIVEEQADAFITKGDANNTTDLTPTPKSSVLGRVVLVIPAVGYFLEFVRSPLGLLLLLLLGFLLTELSWALQKQR